MRRIQLIITLAFVAFLPLLIAARTNAAGTLPSSSATYPATVKPTLSMVKGYGSLPLQFERNDGQTDNHVKFLTHSGNSTLFLTANQAVLCLMKTVGKTSNFDPLDQKAMMNRQPHPAPQKMVESVLRMDAVGATASPEVIGMSELPGKVNYFLGNNPKKWHSNIPTYREVRYRDIYKNIDLAYYGSQGHVEYDFIVKPGGDPRKIALRLTGSKSMRVASTGDLVLTTECGDVTWRKPVVYQERKGSRIPIAGGYVLAKGGEVRFAVAHYDASLPLVIDPMLVYSTYLGGSLDDQANAVAVDNSGCAYLTGSTASTQFPTLNAYQNMLSTAGGYVYIDAFVSKFNSNGRGLIYSTYFGGGSEDDGNAITVASDGTSVCVSGVTFSGDFPVIGNDYDDKFNLGLSGKLISTDPLMVYTDNDSDAFVFELNQTGNALLVSTYIGGTANDYGTGVARDSNGDIFVSGVTQSSDFGDVGEDPTGISSNSIQSAFIAELQPSGSFLQKPLQELTSGNGVQSMALAVDVNGNPYSTGYIESSTNTTNTDAVFVWKIKASNLGSIGYAKVYALTGGGLGIAVDNSENAYVVGLNANSSSGNVSGPSFVIKVNPTGNVVSGYPLPHAVANAVSIDQIGDVYVAGTANSSADFASLIQPTFGGGGSDAFLLRLDPSLTTPIFSTYIGGEANDDGFGIGYDGNGGIYLVGETLSAAFPTTPHAYQSGQAGEGDAFLTKINFGPSVMSFDPTVAEPGASVTLTGSGFSQATSVTFNGTPANLSASAGKVSASASSDTSLTVLVPASATSGPIAVTTPLGTGTSLTNFTVQPPAITTLSPTYAYASGGAFSLTVNGTGFVNGSTVKFGTTSLPTTFSSSTQLTATISSALRATVGTYTVLVVNPNAVTSNSVAFPIKPRLTGFTLSAHKVSGSVSVTGTVTLNGVAPTGGVKIGLTSSATGIATVPASVTVPVGAVTATFPITTKVVTTMWSTTITANGGGATPTATLTVLPPITPTADSFGQDGNSANTNFGGVNPLLVKSSSSAGTNRDTYIQFNLNGFTSIASAKLDLNASLSSAGSITTGIYKSSSSWTEDGLTWNNRPVLGSSIGTFTTAAITNSPIMIDVTAYVQSQLSSGSVSFGLHNSATSTNVTRIISREGGADKPVLIVSGN